MGLLIWIFKKVYVVSDYVQLYDNVYNYNIIMMIFVYLVWFLSIVGLCIVDMYHRKLHTF